MPRAYGMQKDKGDSFFESPALSFGLRTNCTRCSRSSSTRIPLLRSSSAQASRWMPAFRAGDSSSRNMVNLPQFDERWREAALNDGADLIRKAETVLQMIMAARASTPGDIIREALYMDRGGTDIPITRGASLMPSRVFT